MEQNPKTSAAAVSARLHRAGFTTVATRKLEGIRVSRGVMGDVHVVVDHDTPNSAHRVAELLNAELQGWDGYAVRRNADVHFYVSKSAPAPAPAAHDMRAAWQFVVDAYDTGHGAHSPNRADWTDGGILAFVAEHHVDGPDAFKIEGTGK